MLTKSQKYLIKRLSKLPGRISFYKETSFSGKSETLRYQRYWVENGRWGPTTRSESHMVFSVKIYQVRGGRYGPNWIDDPADIEKFNKKCKEAEKLFNELRKKT